MPLHDFRCRNGHISEMMVPNGTESIPCPLCLAHVDIQAEKVFLRAPLSFVREDVRYESPVDGRPITTYQQHLEELARTDCVVYESGIKQDQERNERRRDEKLERSVDETVDREIALMPAAKKERLVAELEGGLTATPERVTPPSRAIVTKLEFPRS